MTELPWFERDLVFGKPKEMLPYFLERLEGTIARIEQKVKGFSEEDLSRQTNGKWSVKQNIGHLVEVDEIANKRITEMVNGISPMSPAVFEPKQDYNKMPIIAVIEFFRRTRKDNIKRYQGLTDAQLSLASIHPRLKASMTPVDLAFFDAEHDDHHLVKINLILKHQ